MPRGPAFTVVEHHARGKRWTQTSVENETLGWQEETATLTGDSPSAQWRDLQALYGVSCLDELLPRAAVENLTSTECSLPLTGIPPGGFGYIHSDFEVPVPELNRWNPQVSQ